MCTCVFHQLWRWHRLFLAIQVVATHPFTLQYTAAYDNPIPPEHPPATCNCCCRERSCSAARARRPLAASRAFCCSRAPSCSRRTSVLCAAALRAAAVSDAVHTCLDAMRARLPRSSARAAWLLARAASMVAARATASCRARSLWASSAFRVALASCWSCRSCSALRRVCSACDHSLPCVGCYMVVVGLVQVAYPG